MGLLITTTTTTTTTWDHRGVLGGGPRENPRSLSSPKAEKFESGKKLTDGPTDRPTYNTWSWLKIGWVGAKKIMTGRPWGIKTKILQASYIPKNSETVEFINVTRSYKHTRYYPSKVIL